MDASLLEVTAPWSFKRSLNQKYSSLNSLVIISFLNFTGCRGIQAFLITCSKHTYTHIHI